MGKAEGFIRLYRSLLDDPIWFNSTPAQKSVLITLLCMVSWQPRQWDILGKPIMLQPGQCFTSLPQIAKKAGRGVTPEIVRKALIRFENLGFCTVKSTNRGRLITIVKWRFYQLDEETENRLENRQRTGREQAESRQRAGREQANKQESNKVRREESNKVIKNLLGDVFQNYTANPELLKALNDWAEARDALRKPLTERAIEINLKRLDEWAPGNDAEKIAIINETIGNGCAGFVRPRNQGKTTIEVQDAGAFEAMNAAMNAKIEAARREARNAKD